ncbi:amidase [Aurantiacibacter aquimixticola]|uniref:Amidase n=1 Tax=Aurantiacibacter aquimixticola TaxID=1958945 RepID=A0A419RWB7_9SPHN|nr:amidase [Aurantiacibacter aquimixticola]RJY10054.1 amidase [Aurantiacibacter aquimixticola]
MSDPIDLSAIRQRDEALNAFVGWDDRAEGGEGPLAGMTVGVKGNIAVKGLPWTTGLAAYRERVAGEDAATVAALRRAGAAVIGALNMEEGALGAKTDNPFYGPVQNPHRLGYSPGGSSGGSGAAVAAGLVDAALGTDTMGSIRIPASHCGIYGFKPATDRVSQHGLEPADLSLDAIGPLARDLDTLERVARAMSDFGEDETDQAGAVLADHGVEVDPQVAGVFDDVLAALSKPPAPVTLDHRNSRIRFAGFIHVSRAMAEHLVAVGSLSAHLQKLLAYGPQRAPDKLAEDSVVLDAAKRRVREIVAEHGYLIMPTVPNTPFPHSQAEPAAQADFTCLANIAALPALSLPAGWTQDGLPIGVQIVGRAGCEAGLFAFARHLDETMRAYRPPAAD